jgi:hypothetical protein
MMYSMFDVGSLTIIRCLYSAQTANQFLDYTEYRGYFSQGVYSARGTCVRACGLGNNLGLTMGVVMFALLGVWV